MKSATSRPAKTEATQSRTGQQSKNAIAQSLLAEFEAELATTRRFLERLPDAKLTWKPHEKSMTAGQLALHIAESPVGVLKMTLAEEASPPNFSGGRPQPTTLRNVLEALETSAAFVRDTLPTIDDDRMNATFKIVEGDKTLMSLPRQGFLRSIMLNHWYHHRGQFGVYLRLVGASVPSSYGPSGDEAPAFARA